MAISEKLREKLESRVADTILLLLAVATSAAGYFLSAFLPEKLIQSFDQFLLAQALGGLLALTLLLSTWVFILRTSDTRNSRPPSRKFFSDFGFWEETGSGVYYCAKCGSTPLGKNEAGWYCITCHWLYESQEHKQKVKREREEEDRRVREFNESRRI